MNQKFKITLILETDINEEVAQNLTVVNIADWVKDMFNGCGIGIVTVERVSEQTENTLSIYSATSKTLLTTTKEQK